VQYPFVVLDTPEVNAFALPGGYIYMTRGILAYLNSEAELAAVLSHELGHVTARHSVRQKIDGMIYADNSSQGIVRGSLFMHTGLGIAFDFPRGWKVQNRPQNVAALSPQGDAVIHLRTAGSAQGVPGDVIRRHVKLPASAINSVVVSGLPAAVADATIDGLPTRVLCVFLGSSAYLIAAQARSVAVFNKRQREIHAALSSLRAISLTFADLARRSPLGRHAEGYLRVLNGIYPTGEPASGQALKIVE
jgi:predicted Zn-dependent protease